VSIGEWAAIISAASAVVLVALVAWVATALRRTLHEANRTLEDARKTINAIDPLVADARSAVTSVETVLKTPGVKAAALASGVGRGVQHLREKLH
jgi:hypothetical protein